MKTSFQLAKHLRDLHFGGNWTCSDLKQQISDVNLEEALHRIPSFNSIAVLVFHIHYYVDAILGVLKGGPLQSDDKLSFDLPELSSESEWQLMKENCLKDAEALAGYIERLPDEKLGEIFVDPKYGTYFRNIAGLIEHSHYHLGQIAVLKKLIRSGIHGI